MRIGILADIHEAVEPLALAVRALEARRVDATVMLGDILETGERIAEAVALVERLPGPGVWGNHDFGLCGEVSPAVAGLVPAAVLEYFARLRPWVDLGGWRFQHVDPHLDPTRLDHLWSFLSPKERVAGFAACAFPRACVGHLHGWGAFTPERRLDWEGERTLELPRGERRLVVVNAVVNGWCAIVDTGREVLEPIRSGGGRWVGAAGGPPGRRAPE